MTEVIKREFKLVPIGKVHPSSILSPRSYTSDLAESIEKNGIQQALTVRPLVDKPDEYELINGHGRRASVKDEQTEVFVDIRYGIKDSDLFRISESTFCRTGRSPYDKSKFYAAWAAQLEKEVGKSEGVQASLARETGLSESLISQYMAIGGLFAKLESLAPREEFNALKSWGVNRLFKFSQMVECERLLDIAKEFEGMGEVSIEEVNRVVSENRVSSVSSPALLELDQGQYETPNEARQKRAQRLVEEVDSLATETNQLLNTIAAKIRANVADFSTVEVLGVYDKVLNALKRLRKRAETLHQKMSDHRQQPGDSSEVGER